MARAAKASAKGGAKEGGAPFELRTSPSAARLRDACVSTILEASRQGESVAVVAPTARLLDVLRRALLQASPGGVVAGVHFLHHRALATHLLAHASLRGLVDAPPPRLLSSIEAHALAAAAVASLPASSPLRALCADRPRFVASLRASLGELREAGVAAAALRAELGADADIGVLHDIHERLIADHGRSAAACDAAAHARAAASAAEALAGAGRMPWSRLILHGAWELTGTQADLVEAVSRAIPVTMFAPSGDGPAHESSRRALTRFPGARAQARPLDEPGAEPTLLDTAALCDEDAPAARIRLPESAVLEAFHVRGSRAEVELAARLCAEAHLRRGVPLEEIGVACRSLEPIAPHLPAAFAARGVPFTTSAQAPLLREPWATAAATLLDALAEDLPRPLVSELLRSPWTRLHDKAEADAIVPDLWDEWTLAARVVRGAGALRDDVLAWHDADLREQALRRETDLAALAAEPWAALRRARIAALGEIARRLDEDRAAWQRCRTHGEHATALREILARWLREPGEGSPAARARGIVLGIFDDIERLDGIPQPSDAPPAIADVRRLVADALASAGLPMGTPDGSGVRVLSAMSARAMPFRELILLGFTQGSFPRRPRQDPFLDDAARAKLRRHAPALGVKRESRDEERQLLAVLLGAATERIHVAWQRADDDGSARAPSLFLREIARVTLGRPDLAAITARRAGDGDPELARRLPLMAVPGHPALASAALRARFGRATLADALVEAAERPQRRRAVERLAREAGILGPDLAASLQSLGLLESFRLHADPALRRAQLAHDGLLGPGVVPVPDSPSVSALQSFGRCTLQWLFSRDLGIPQRDDEPDPAALGADELGSCVHAALEAVNRSVIERGGDPRHLASSESLDVLRATWEGQVDALAGARRSRVPLAWDVLAEAWLGTLERFLQEDAERLTSFDARITHAEHDLAETVSFRSGGRDVRLALHGRVDRIVRMPGGWWIHDYKTSANAKGNVEKAKVLKGQSLQGLAYLLMLREWAARQDQGRHLGVTFLPVHPSCETFEPVELEVDELEESWSETLAVLDSTWRAGAFAFRKGSCGWCDFQAACRVDHPPTRERMKQAPEWADYLLLSRKSSVKGSRLLSEIRERLAAGGDEGGEDES